MMLVIHKLSTGHPKRSVHIEKKQQKQKIKIKYTRSIMQEEKIEAI